MFWLCCLARELGALGRRHVDGGYGNVRSFRPLSVTCTHWGQIEVFISAERLSSREQQAGISKHSCQREQHIISVIKPLKCFDPRCISHKKMCFHAMLFKEEAILLHVMHYLWENSLYFSPIFLDLFLIERSVPLGEARSWFLMFSQVGASDRCSRRMCVCVCNSTAVQNKQVVSHWITAVVFKTHTRPHVCRLWLTLSLMSKFHCLLWFIVIQSI